jgi:hypothetical protein
VTSLFGAYQLRARVQPLLLVAFPVAVLAYALGAADDLIGRVGAALATFGVTTLLAALARDRGRVIEADLWRSWGGPPTTAMMLSTSEPPSRNLQAHRRHAHRLLPDIERLSDDRDRADPEGSRQDIEQFTTYLRERTRDRQRFPIVFDANVGYGFRRNSLGLRPVGLVVSVVTAVVGAVGLVLVLTHNLDRPVPGLLAAIGIAAAAAVLWARASGEWVRVEAIHYAEALLAAAEAIDAPAGLRRT